MKKSFLEVVSYLDFSKFKKILLKSPEVLNYLHHHQLARELRFHFPYEEKRDYAALYPEKISLRDFLASDFGEITLKVFRIFYDRIQEWKETERIALNYEKDPVYRYYDFRSARFSQFYRGVFANPHNDVLEFLRTHETHKIPPDEIFAILEESSYHENPSLFLWAFDNYLATEARIPLEDLNILVSNLLERKNLRGFQALNQEYPDRPREIIHPSLVYLGSLEVIEAIKEHLELSSEELGALIVQEGRDVHYGGGVKDPVVVKAIHTDLKIPIEFLLEKGYSYYQGEAFEYLLGALDPPNLEIISKILQLLLKYPLDDENIKAILSKYPEVREVPFNKLLDYISHYYMGSPLRARLVYELHFEEGPPKVEDLVQVLSGPNILQWPLFIKECHLGAPEFFSSDYLELVKMRIIQGITRHEDRESYYDFESYEEELYEIIEYFLKEVPLFKEGYPEFVKYLWEDPNTSKCLMKLKEKGLLGDLTGDWDESWDE